MTGNSRVDCDSDHHRGDLDRDYRVVISALVQDNECGGDRWIRHLGLFGARDIKGGKLTLVGGNQGCPMCDYSLHTVQNAARSSRR